MNLIMEFLFELFIEGSIEISANRKVSKWIRYPLLFIISLFYISLILIIIWLGIIIFKKNIIIGISLWIVAILLIIGIIIFKRKMNERGL